MSERTKIVVVIEGGVVREVYGNNDRVDVLIADYDIEGTDRKQCALDEKGEALVISAHVVDVSYHRISVFDRAMSMSTHGVPAKQCKVYLTSMILEMGIGADMEIQALNKVLKAIDDMSDKDGLIHLPGLLYTLEHETRVTWDLAVVTDHLVRHLKPMQ